LIPIPKPIQLFEISKYLTSPIYLCTYLLTVAHHQVLGEYNSLTTAQTTDGTMHKRGATNYSTHSY